jgi:hypothetical protein
MYRIFTVINFIKRRKGFKRQKEGEAGLGG